MPDQTPTPPKPTTSSAGSSDQKPDGSKDHLTTLGISPSDLRGKSDEEIEKFLREKLKQLKEEDEQEQDPEKKKKKDFWDQLLEAIEALIKKDKREDYFKAREKFLADQQAQTKVEVFSPEKNPNDVPASTAKNPTYQAKASLDDIKDEFNEFVKAKLGGQDPEKAGYKAELKTNPKTGEKTLLLTFPSKEAANEFIKSMMEKDMLHDPSKGMGKSPTPLKTTPSPTSK